MLPEASRRNNRDQTTHDLYRFLEVEDMYDCSSELDEVAKLQKRRQTYAGARSTVNE